MLGTNIKIYTKELIINIKKQWWQSWMVVYSIVGLIILILSILLSLNIISLETFSAVAAKVLVSVFYISIDFLVLYYCAYKHSGTKYIGFSLILQLFLFYMML